MSGSFYSSRGLNGLPAPWTGILAPHCHLCSWAWNGTKMEVKFLNSSCPEHGHGITLGGPFRADVEAQEAENERN